MEITIGSAIESKSPRTGFSFICVCSIFLFPPVLLFVLFFFCFSFALLFYFCSIFLFGFFLKRNCPGTFSRRGAVETKKRHAVTGTTGNCVAKIESL